MKTAAALILLGALTASATPLSTTTQVDNNIRPLVTPTIRPTYIPAPILYAQIGGTGTDPIPGDAPSDPITVSPQAQYYMNLFGISVIVLCESYAPCAWLLNTIYQ